MHITYFIMSYERKSLNISQWDRISDVRFKTHCSAGGNGKGFLPSFCLDQWFLTHCGRVTQICVFNTVKLGKSASSP